MEQKTDKVYINPGETRKRKTSEVVWASIWGILLLAWTLFMLTLSFKVEGFWDLSKDMFAVLFLSSIPFFIFLGGFSHMLIKKVYVRPLGYAIYSFKEWNFDDCMYETFYTYERYNLYAHYVYSHHIGDFIHKLNEEEVMKELASENIFKRTRYKTQDEAMRAILESVENLIAHEKASKNIKIKNIQTLEEFSVDDLKQKFSAGDYDDLIEKEDSKEQDNKE